MIIDKSKLSIEEKIDLGLQMAYEKLVRKEARDGGSLVFEINGKIQHIPAAQLLLQLKK